MPIDSKREADGLGGMALLDADSVVGSNAPWMSFTSAFGAAVAPEAVGGGGGGGGIGQLPGEKERWLRRERGGSRAQEDPIDWAAFFETLCQSFHPP
mmetsp:Transcript_6476/g.12612  ORF Transcript_6476/g.12612 Transcript_6476/m.12612 type:complete len:97 (-) Transcript_6476:381-671(-)